MALEQRDAQCVLDLAQAAEDGRVVDAEPLGGGRQALGVGDGLDQPEVVPGQIFERFGHSFLPWMQ